MKHWVSLSIVLLLLLAACGQSQPAEAPTAAPAATTAESEPTASDDQSAAEGDLEVDKARLSDELYLFNWSEYLEPQLLDEFEQEYGVRVIQDFYDANESMIPKIRAGNSGYDLVVPSDYAVEILSREGLLAPLDKDLLPNLEHLNPALLDLAYDPGNTYSVPYFWGTTGIAYNSAFFDAPPDSWGVFFEQASLEEIAGRFTMLEDPRETPGAALFYLGKSVNTTNEEDLAAAQQLLIEQKPYLAAYDSSNVNLKLSTEEIIIAHAFDGLAATARLGIDDKPGNPDIAYAIPREGGVIWQDNLAIVAESPNHYTAHVFINFLLRPDVAARNTDYVLYLTPNKAAIPLLAEETREVFEIIEPDDETIEQMQWIERSEESDQLYNDLWVEVISR